MDSDHANMPNKACRGDVWPQGSIFSEGDILMLKKTRIADSSTHTRFGRPAFIAGCAMALLCVIVLLFGLRSLALKASESHMTKDPFLTLMTQAAAHAKQHGDRFVPALSPAC